MDILPLWRRVFGGGGGASELMRRGAGADLMRFAGNPSHLNGVPRHIAIFTLGSLAKLLLSVLNTTTVHNAATLLHLASSRPPGTPLITASNHMSTLDDPLLWAHKGFPITNPLLSRWILAAQDICFTNSLFTYFFRVGKCIPIKRGAGVHQPFMDEAVDRLNEGDWVHTFPEGKVFQEYGPMRRFKWGVGSLVARSSVTPLVLPMAHCGFEKIMPESYLFGRRPLLPLCGKKVTIIIGEPMEFNITHLRDTAMKFSGSSDSPFPVRFNAFGQNPSSRKLPEHLAALDESSLGWLYSHITNQIQLAVEDLRLTAMEKNGLRPP